MSLVIENLPEMIRFPQRPQRILSGLWGQAFSLSGL